MLLDNLYDTWLSEKETVPLTVCIIWEKVCMSECMVGYVSLFMVTNRKMYIKDCLETWLLRGPMFEL